MNCSGDDGSSSERRSSRRHYIRARALVDAPDGSFQAEAVDVSISGVCLTSPVALQPGTYCRLQVELYGNTSPTIAVAGRVCFCIEDHGQFRVGVHCADADKLVAAVQG